MNEVNERYRNGGFISKLSYSYITPLVKNPDGIRYDEASFTESVQSEQTDRGVAQFWKAWNKELTKPKPSILRTFVKIRAIPFIITYLIRVFSILLTYLITYTMKWLLSWATSTTSKWYQGLLICALYLGVYFLKIVVNSQFFFQMFKQGQVFRNTLVRAISQHIHRLSPQSRLQIGSGTLTNLATSDAMQIDMIARQINEILDLPLYFLLSIGTLVNLLDATSLWGIAVLVLFAPLSFFITRSTTALKKQRRRETDERVKKTSESVHGIKIIKMNGWEEPMKDAICKVREREMKLVQSQEFRMNFSSFISNGSELVSSLLVVVLQFSRGKKLTAATLFPALNALAVLRNPIMALPRTIGTMIEAVQILDRYQAFLLCEQYPNYKREKAPNGEPVMILQPMDELPKDRHLASITQQMPSDVDEEMSFSDQDQRGSSFIAGDSSDIVVEMNDTTFVRSTFTAVEFAKPDKKKKPSKRPSSPSSTALLSSTSSSSLKTTSFDIGRPVLSNMTVSLPRGSHTILVGPVGSGKSSFLSALLGELNCSSGRGRVVGKMAFLPQSPWILNATVEENITFGHPFDGEKYRRIVECCCLEADFVALPAGDQTEIGERGITLSGGQRVRVALARACYAEADVILLDDPFASVDASVGETIMERCVGELLKEKTVICTTHHTSLIGRFDWVVELSEDGRIVKQGKPTEFGHLSDMEENQKEEEAQTPDMLNKLSPTPFKSPQLSQPTAQPSVFTDATPLRRTNASPPNPTTPIVTPPLTPSNIGYSLTTKEEESTKGVSRDVYKFYLSTIPTFLIVLVFVVNLAAEICSVCEPYALSALTREDAGTGGSKAKVFTFYLVTQLVSLALVFPQASVVIQATIRAALHIHEICIRRLFSAPLSYFDVTPTGRLLGRFSKDLESVDGGIPHAMSFQVRSSFSLVASFIGVAISMPILLLIIPPFFVLIFKHNKIFQTSGLRVRRYLSVARTAQLHDLTQQLNGMATIRAFDRDSDFIKTSKGILDKSASGEFVLNSSNRRVSLLLETDSMIIIASICVFAIILKGFNRSLAFLPVALNLSSSVVSSLSNQLRHISMLENEMTSVEKLQEIATIEQEPARYVFSREGDKTRKWPTKGEIEYKQVDVRYRPDLPLSLSGLSFKVKGGQKVGIVGRTGSGKSTLILSLLRLVEVESGEIWIDSKETKTEVGLHELRLSVATTPQLPTLFEGSIRFNLDPFNEVKDDRMIWEALEEVGMAGFVKSLKGRLDSAVAEDGGNLSVGQQQLLCLSRALLKKEKIVLLDEATSSVDLETDKKIQQAIRNSFSDATVITVAHRLSTVADADMILVMEKGAVVESGSPAELLRNSSSVFYDLAMASGEKYLKSVQAVAFERESA
ncbi:Multidrug resistance-associated protein [Blattamonas nauphoetae]|uniref:Multidrug resistance-associated protein n=1 Tax=Blattamonas nauphoetae TaxID=2049346 RepID=A0ABQ9Y713_9EUKA|nr:Multidrug resistance-associated protein [Blattamonas nauphoetae]